MHAAQDGRKVKSFIRFLYLEQLLAGVDRVSGKDVHTQPQPDEEAGGGCGQKGVEIAAKQKKAESSKTKIVLPRVPV